MAVRKLDKRQWRSFFERVSKNIVGKHTEIEVASLDLGDQIAAEWLPLLRISYDPRDDIIHITLDGLDHTIRAPREVYVDLGPTELTSMEIIDADDVLQIVQLRDPLALQAPSSASG
jgi:uncharacterized protein YuzE